VLMRRGLSHEPAELPITRVNAGVDCLLCPPLGQWAVAPLARDAAKGGRSARARNGALGGGQAHFPENPVGTPAAAALVRGAGGQARRAGGIPDLGSIYEKPVQHSAPW